MLRKLDTNTNLPVQTDGRNEPDAMCNWCYAVNICFVLITHFPKLPHALAPVIVPLLKTMQQVGNSPNGEEKRGGWSKFSGCVITKRAESEKLA